LRYQFGPDQERLPQIDAGIGQASALADMMLCLDKLARLASGLEGNIIEFLDGDLELGCERPNSPIIGDGLAVVA
jgi:hypothetical protein